MSIFRNTYSPPSRRHPRSFQGERRLHHAVGNQELKDSFKNLYLDEDASGAATTVGTSGAGTSGSASVASAGT